VLRGHDTVAADLVTRKAPDRDHGSPGFPVGVDQLFQAGVRIPEDHVVR
jgi:hypothetical protein